MPPTSARPNIYQDPVDPNMKSAEATVTFSHPVDPAQFEKRVSMEIVAGKGRVWTEPRKYGFKITYDKLKLNGYIHSEPIEIPQTDSTIRVIVDPGVRAAAGGPPTSARVEKLIDIPGLYSVFELLPQNSRS